MEEAYSRTLVYTFEMVITIYFSIFRASYHAIMLNHLYNYFSLFPAFLYYIVGPGKHKPHEDIYFWLALETEITINNNTVCTLFSIWRLINELYLFPLSLVYAEAHITN